MKNWAFIAGILVVIGGAIYGVLYFDRISIGPNFQAQPLDFPEFKQPTLEQNESWLTFLSEQEETPYTYPATELSVKFDFADKNHSKQSFPSAISIDNLDEYKFACVKQVLRQNNIESAYYKSGNVLKLVVFLSDEAMHDKLIADLKYYRLSYVVQ